VTDHELHFRNDRLQLQKEGRPDKCVKELVRSLTTEELEINRAWADRALRDVLGAQVLTDEILNCSIRLLHKGGDTSNKPSDWRPLPNVCMQLVHHVVNYRLTVITEAENLIAPGQDGGRAGRGVDLNQLKLYWITSEAQRLKRRVFRIDIDFKNAFHSMSKSALWALPDNGVHGPRRCQMCNNHVPKWRDTGWGLTSPDLHDFCQCITGDLTGTGKALGISDGIEETEQFNNVAFMDDITTLSQDNGGAQSLLNAVQEFEH